MKYIRSCSHCGATLKEYIHPIPTVDIIIEFEDNRIVLIERKNPPYGWAIPGGFCDWGESLEDAAVREAFEETSLVVRLKKQFHTYSSPLRDSRYHTISTVFIATACGNPKAGDDAQSIGIFTKEDVPENLAFDHGHILDDYFSDRY
ncbi:MAG: NUDIX hydrolase [Thermodesulfobacteriota bacterium]|nr:NUDIX hydrolase [Thermodesulfobacteriota bacterium]